MAGKRLTRKEIQEDKIKKALQGTYGWVTENRNLLIAGAGVVLLLVTAGYAVWNYLSRQDDELQVVFADAQKIYQAGSSGEEPVVEPGHEGHQHASLGDLQFETAEERDQKALAAFQAIAEDYSGTLAEFAAYYAALCRDRLGNMAEAESALQELTQSARSPEVVSLARGHLAYLGEVQGNWALAIESLRQIAEAPSNSFTRETALYKLARVLEAAGNKTEALEQYRLLIAEFPLTPNSRQVTSRIDVLAALLESDTPSEDPEANQES